MPDKERPRDWAVGRVGVCGHVGSKEQAVREEPCDNKLPGQRIEGRRRRVLIASDISLLDSFETLLTLKHS